jgi:hypothetical protein
VAILGYVKADREPLQSFYLATDRLVTETDPNSDEAKCVLREIVPVPIRSVRDDISSSIMAAMTPEGAGSSMYKWSAAVVTDRDRGFYDNLCDVIFTQWLKRPDYKKLLFDELRLTGKMTSPYHSLAASLETIAGLRITGLLIEVADSPDETSLSLGAAVLVSKKECAEKWRLKSKNYRDLTMEERRSSEAKIIDCYLDEVFGLHLATGLPIYTAETLYRRVCIDGLLENKESGISLSAPYFDSLRDSISWNKQLEESRARPAKAVKKVNEITDASTFLRMRLSEKRACLRASGVFNLPR